MSLFSRLLQTVHSWRRRRVGPRTSKRAAVAMEHLDHRQLLSVNFTGNVTTDFPSSEQNNGVAILNDPNNIQPVIPQVLQKYVYVSGFDISQLRVTYDSTTDTLNVGINQPPASP